MGVADYSKTLVNTYWTTLYRDHEGYNLNHEHHVLRLAL
jgi:hypothetical protein